MSTPASSTPTPIPAPQPHRNKALRITAISILSLVILLSGAGGYGYWLLTKSIPVTEGEISLLGLDQPVTVWREPTGVPHMEAHSMDDLFFAQGYVTASERLFQMDLMRRQASGQLSEVFGESTLEKDKFFRAFGLQRAAVLSYEKHSTESRDLLDSYAKGVTAFINQAKAEGTLPIEFTILGYQPTEWSSIDSLSILKLMAYDLSRSWRLQAFNYFLHQKFPDNKAIELYPTYPEGRITILQALKENPIDIEKSFATASFPNQFNGSNNWVLAGKKTESGKPMLANDPHLAIGAPAIWFEVHLKGDNYEASGASIPGLPAVISGNTPHIAWGVTNVNPDVQDLYIEKRNPNNPHEFEYMGKWEAAQVITEEINVKDKAPVPYEVVITRHGPIISEFAHDDKPDTALAMRWTANEPTAELDAFLGIARAKTFNQFKQALAFYKVPAQNFVFASQYGEVGYRANGLIPIRKQGKALVPVPGWTDEYEWQGFIPYDELPMEHNPPAGFIATANNKVIDDNYPYHISNSWAQPYRQERIVEVLTSKERLSLEDMQQLQMDQKNLWAQEFVPILLKQLQSIEQTKLRPQDQAVVALLQQWDYVDRAEQAAPLVFATWMRNVPKYLFEQELGKKMYEMANDTSIVTDQLIRNADAGKPGVWIQEKGGLPAVALASLQISVDEITKKQGKDTSKWKWGQEHTVTFAHPLSAVKPLDLLFTPTHLPMGGSRVTTQAAAHDPEKGIVHHGGPWRRVIDMADISKSYNLLGPGQSGHVMSKWYADQAEAWVKGEYHITSTNPETYQATASRLTLMPVGK